MPINGATSPQKIMHPSTEYMRGGRSSKTRRGRNSAADAFSQKTHSFPPNPSKKPAAILRLSLPQLLRTMSLPLRIHSLQPSNLSLFRGVRKGSALRAGLHLLKGEPLHIINKCAKQISIDINTNTNKSNCRTPGATKVDTMATSPLSSGRPTVIIQNKISRKNAKMGISIIGTIKLMRKSNTHENPSNMIDTWEGAKSNTRAMSTEDAMREQATMEERVRSGPTSSTTSRAFINLVNTRW